MSSVLSLDKVPVGSGGLISAISSECDRAGRLSVLGFIPGRSLRVVRVAPLGDPISVSLDAQEISLRLTEAALIQVSVQP